MSPQELYEKLKPFLSVERASWSNGWPPRFFVENGGQYALRWSPKGEQRPTFTQFKKAYGLGHCDG